MAAAFVLGEVCAARHLGAGVFLGLFLIAALYIIKNRKKFYKSFLIEVIVLLFCFCFGNFRFYTEEQKCSLQEWVTERRQIEFWGRVDWVKETEYGTTVLLSQVTIQKGEKGLVLSAYVKEASAVGIYPGDIIWAKGVLKDFERARNPGEFDSYSYYHSMGCHYSCSIEEIIAVQPAKIPIYKGLMLVRNKMRRIYQQICTPAASGIYQAMLLGEKEDLPKEIKGLYSANGISHILAISGLHIAMLGMGIYYMARRVGGFTFSGVFAGIIISLYILMTGSAVSACRAGIMFFIQLFSYICRRSYDMLSAAAIAMLCLLIKNPWFLYNSGFQLSFSAVFAIGILYPYLQQKMDAKNTIYQSFLSSLSISLITFPILSWNFYEISPYSILLNVIVIPLMSLVMLSGILGGVAALLCFPAAGRFFIALGEVLLLFYEWLCNIIQKFPGSQVITGKPMVLCMFLYYFLLYGILILWKKKRSIGLLVVLLMLPFLLTLQKKQDIYICFLDVSQGDGIYIETKEGVRILIDGGSTDKKKLYEKTLLPFLKFKGASKLDYVIVTHPDEDHISALRELIQKKEIRVNQLLLPQISVEIQDASYLAIFGLAKEAGIPVGFLLEQSQLHIGNLSVICVYPYKGLKTEGRNGYSIVLSVDYKEFSMLLTGDLDSAGERYLIENATIKPKHYTILKVSHHGSKYSSQKEFLEKFSADYAVISCGAKNSYGHPHKETIERLGQAGIIVITTMEEGAVIWKE